MRLSGPAGRVVCPTGGLSGLRAFPGVACSGGLAQLVEHLLCKQGVNGSSPLSSTIEVIDMMGTRKHNF